MPVPAVACSCVWLRACVPACAVDCMRVFACSCLRACLPGRVRSTEVPCLKRPLQRQSSQVQGTNGSQCSSKVPVLIEIGPWRDFADHLSKVSSSLADVLVVALQVFFYVMLTT